MPSWQARLISGFIRIVVRRRHWGDERALTRRARFLFGAPAPLRWLYTRGVECEQVRDGDVRGEWITPPDATPGVVLYIHGGGFVACSAATHRPVTAALACLTKRRVFSVDYRLAPEHQYPAAHDDVLAAYEWLLNTTSSSSRIVVAGDSAGGNLAITLVARLRDLGKAMPACVVAFSPWTDLTGSGRSVRMNDGRCAMFRPANMTDFASVAAGDHRTDDPALSPVFADLGGLPPVLLHVGSTELLLDDATRVHELIGASGGTSVLEIYDDVPHAWQLLAPFVPESTASLRAAADFIALYSRTELA